MKNKARAARIAREWAEMKLKPWQMSPSEISDSPNPFADSPGTGACKAWDEAAKWRADILKENPHYFDGDSPDDYADEDDWKNE